MPIFFFFFFIFPIPVYSHRCGGTWIQAINSKRLSEYFPVYSYSNGGGGGGYAEWQAVWWDEGASECGLHQNIFDMNKQKCVGGGGVSRKLHRWLYL